MWPRAQSRAGRTWPAPSARPTQRRRRRPRRGARRAIATGDADLELRALAQLGLAEVTLGEVDRGLAPLDEAMAAVTGGEPATSRPSRVRCTLIHACDRAGDTERPHQRAQSSRPSCAPTTTCRSSRSAARAAPTLRGDGSVDAAERELGEAARELEAAGQRARCVPPAARLAEIRVLQGRYEEAEQLRAGPEREPEAVGARSPSAWPGASRPPQPRRDPQARRARPGEPTCRAAARPAGRGGAGAQATSTARPRRPARSTGSRARPEGTRQAQATAARGRVA